LRVRVIRSCCWRTRLASSDRRALASDNGTGVAAIVMVRSIDLASQLLDQQPGPREAGNYPSYACPSRFLIDIEAESLPRVWADVGAAAGDGEDQALIAEDLDRAQNGVATDVMLLLELLHGRQGTIAPLTLSDPGPEDGGELLVGRFRRAMINGHMIKLDHQRPELIT
jgi:hypothetical protein